MQKKWLKPLQKEPENGPKTCIFSQFNVVK